MKMNSINGFGLFVLGICAGAIITRGFLKAEYAQKTKEEIESIRDFYNEKITLQNKVEEKSENPTEKKVEAYKDMVEHLGYRQYSHEHVHTSEKVQEDRPYLIAAEDFGTLAGYEAISLIYYSDHVLTDEMNEFVEDVDDVIGFESLNHFDDYEEDAVFVRNDRLKADYEILKDNRPYSEAINLTYQ
ncbi:MAG: hypothetical protein Q4C65_02575 [Eubacteriales bacterium]|nr:hypothetical protein [Eubacteriales bacterium]